MSVAQNPRASAAAVVSDEDLEEGMGRTAIVKSDDELQPPLLALEHQLVDEKQDRVVVGAESLGLELGHCTIARSLVAGVDSGDEDANVGEAGRLTGRQYTILLGRRTGLTAMAFSTPARSASCSVWM